MEKLKKSLLTLTLVASLLLISCTTTREVKLTVPDFPTLENVEDAKDCGSYWVIDRDYWIKLNIYIANCEKTFDIMKALNLTE